MVQPLLSRLAKLRNPLKNREKTGPGNHVPRQGLLELVDLRRGQRTDNENISRAACKIAYLGRDTALCRVLGRYKAYVDTNDIGLSSHLMLDGYWEMWVTETLAELIRPGMVVADIGANIGYFTLLMAELVGPAGRVHAFEPNPRLVDLVNRSLMVNGFSRWAGVHQTALGDRNDQSVTLVVPPLTPMNAYILPADAAVPPNGVEVPVARLDSLDDWRAIELAKIDVEGAEEMIWAGMQGLLDGGTLKTVIIEFNPHRYDKPSEFLHRLCDHGFVLNHLTLSEGVVPIDMDHALDRPGTEDIMLVLRR